jgi:hypothetical protein
MAERDWGDLLARWSERVLASPELAGDLPEDARVSRWLGYPGATEDAIARAEARLRTRLPPSYREFLAASNGFRQIGGFIHRVWSAEEVDWFAARNGQWIDAYVNPPAFMSMFVGDTPRLTDEEYFVYGEEQDTARFRHEYLKTALEVSERGDDAILLLNPKVVTPEGEWEAWFFANWLPGASRYRSFWELMKEECEGEL